jgi:hypothetical protein
MACRPGPRLPEPPPTSSSRPPGRRRPGALPACHRTTGAFGARRPPQVSHTGRRWPRARCRGGLPGPPGGLPLSGCRPETGGLASGGSYSGRLPWPVPADAGVGCLRRGAGAAAVGGAGSGHGRSRFRLLRPRCGENRHAARYLVVFDRGTREHAARDQVGAACEPLIGYYPQTAVGVAASGPGFTRRFGPVRAFRGHGHRRPGAVCGLMWAATHRCGAPIKASPSRACRARAVPAVREAVTVIAVSAVGRARPTAGYRSYDLGVVDVIAPRFPAGHGMITAARGPAGENAALRSGSPLPQQ